MAVKKKNNGKVIGSVGSFTIRQIPTMKGNLVETSTIAIFAGKVKIKDGFKNVDEVKEFVSKNTYNKRKKQFT